MSITPTDNATLRALADARGLDLGVALTGWAMNDPDLGQRCRQLSAENFNLAVIEHGFYMSSIHPEPDTYSFDVADGYYQFAIEHGMRMRGHAIAFPGWATPVWVSRMRDLGAMRTMLREHVATVLARYPALAEIVAVNEPFLPGHEARGSDPFHAVLGHEFLDIVFGAIREASPSMLAIYNDTLNHATYGVNGITTRLTQENLEYLDSAGLIDERFSLGMQLHLRAHDLPTIDDFTKTIQSYHDRHGCQVVVTEFDVDMSGVSGSKSERAELHGQITADFLRAYLAAGVGGSFSFWGIGDAFSYLEIDYGKHDADPTLFDEELQPKPAYGTVADVLRSAGS